MPEPSPKPQSRLPWISGLTLVLLALFGAGAASYRYETAQVRKQRLGELTAIGELKAAQVTSWRRERLTELSIVATSAYARVLAARLVSNPADTQVRAELADRLAGVQRLTGFARASVVTSDGRVLFSTGAGATTIEPAERALARAVLAEDAALAGDFFLNADGDPRISFAAPIRDEDQALAGVLVFRRDPRAIIFPLLRWPLPSQTAEALLVSRDTDGLTILNDSSGGLAAPEMTRLGNDPANGLALLVARATAVPSPGPIEGVDHHGRAVVADVRPVPGTRWLLVSKISSDEIFSEAHYRGRSILLLVSLAALLAAMATITLFRRRQRELHEGLSLEQKRSRVAESEARATLYSIGDAVITTDARGRVGRMNPPASRLTGWPEAEARGRPLEEVFRVRELQSGNPIASPAMRALRESSIVGLAHDAVLVSRDGTEVAISDSAAPIRDERGVLSGAVLVFRDQTQERELRRKLEDDARRMRFLLDEAVDGIVLTDDQGAVVDANRSYARMLGYDQASVLTLHIWDWDQQLDTREKYLAAYPQAARGAVDTERKPGRFEAVFRRSDGSTIDVEVSYTPVLWDGRWCAFSICRDITDRKQTDARLRQSEQEFRLFAEFVPMMTWMADPRGEIYYLNQRWYDYTGMRPEQSVGQGWTRALHPDDAAAAAPAWKDSVETGAPFAYELRARRHDGTYRWFLSRGMPVRDASGHVVRWIGISTDVDDIKNAQARLEETLALRTQDLIAARDQAESANRVKDIFLATMSHELRTPLNAIIGFSELMLAGITGAMNEEQTRQLEIIRKSGHQLLGLITEVLDISKIETGQLVLQPAPLELAPLLDEQRQAFEIQAGERSLRLDVELPDGDLRAVGDPKRVRQVLGNLLSNALKYTDAGTVRVWAERTGHEARIIVEDTGIGIAPRDVANLFQPFYRAESGTGPQREGTGLGLAVSRRLARAMGGDIVVASEVGHGSRFSFTLPLAH